MATMARVLTHLTTPKTIAFKSVRLTEFSNLVCRAHTHSKSMIQTILRTNLTIRRRGICKTPGEDQDGQGRAEHKPDQGGLGETRLKGPEVVGCDVP